jgi:hypothetical protein
VHSLVWHWTRDWCFVLNNSQKGLAGKNWKRNVVVFVEIFENWTCNLWGASLIGASFTCT